MSSDLMCLTKKSIYIENFYCDTIAVFKSIKNNISTFCRRKHMTWFITRKFSNFCPTKTYDIVYYKERFKLHVIFTTSFACSRCCDHAFGTQATQEEAGKHAKKTSRLDGSKDCLHMSTNFSIRFGGSIKHFLN